MGAGLVLEPVWPIRGVDTDRVDACVTVNSGGADARDMLDPGGLVGGHARAQAASVRRTIAATRSGTPSGNSG